jgi:hypothetical protein
LKGASGASKHFVPPSPPEAAEVLAPLEAVVVAPLPELPVDPVEPVLLPPGVPVLELLLQASADTPRPNAATAPSTQAIFTDFIRYAFQ